MNQKRKQSPKKIQKTPKLRKAKVEQVTSRNERNQAAYEQLLSEELCDDLSRKFGRGSHYGSIAAEFVCLRSLISRKERCSLAMLLHDMYETDDQLREFLRRWDKAIYNYILACIHHEDWRSQARGCELDANLMRPLAEEYLRDRKTLMRFLSAAFKRWRQIYAPDSLHRVRIVVQQIARRFGYDRNRILSRLQKIGAVPNALTQAQHSSWLSRIGQYLSRDQRAAAGKDFGFRR